MSTRVNITRSAPSRVAQSINLAVFLGALLVILITINVFASKPGLREQFDATKTRSYSLSAQSRSLLASLQGQWTIAMVVSEANVPRSMRKQIDEVLRRYTDASASIRVLRIDPDNPRTLRAYETLLRDLQTLYKDEIARHDAALDSGVSAFNGFMIFAQQHAGALKDVAAALPETDASRRRLDQSAGALQRIADNGATVLEAVRAARRIDAGQPLADYAGAQSIVATALSSYAVETDTVASILRSWQNRTDLHPNAKTFAANAVAQFGDMSQQLAVAADALKQLPALDVGDIGRQLGEGEAAVILSPSRATVVPSTQLFPKSNLRSTGDGGVSFDQRFRGEQLLSAAIRSLTVEQMPRVVFVHAESDSLLRARDKAADLTGVTSVLRASRYHVQEWNVVKESGPPAAKPGQKTVWIIVPPPPASSIEATPAVRAIYSATEKIVIDGENVLLSVYPSLLVKYGQPDPLAALAAPFGVTPDTGTIVLEQTPVAQAENRVTLNQEVQDYDGATVIGRAVDGQKTAFSWPVPLRLTQGDTRGDNATIRTIAAIEPSPARWLETDWTGNLNEREPQPAQRFAEPVPIAVAAERARGAGAQQRMIVVGSGGWMISNVSDFVVSLGGERVALVNPGNHELMLASVAWLAGLDDLVAASPLTQEVSRLRGITPAVRATWWWVIVVGVPAACLVVGSLVYWWRRF